MSDGAGRHPLAAFFGVLSARLLGGVRRDHGLALHLWHAGFRIFVIAFNLLKDAEPAKRLRRPCGDGHSFGIVITVLPSLEQLIFW